MKYFPKKQTKNSNIKMDIFYICEKVKMDFHGKNFISRQTVTERKNVGITTLDKKILIC